MYRSVLRVVAIFFTSILLLCTVAQAEVSDQDITRVEDALNQITTFKASFMQQSDDGTYASGTFYLSRPGNIRWEYNKPTPILIVGQKSLIAYYDAQLDEVSYMHLEDALASFLTYEHIDLRHTLKVISMERVQGILRIQLMPVNAQTQGKVTLVFEDKTMILKGLEVIDTIGKHTSIAFSNIEQAIPMDSGLFVYPKEKKKGRKTH